jgi:hypothetical protein
MTLADTYAITTSGDPAMLISAAAYDFVLSIHPLLSLLHGIHSSRCDFSPAVKSCSGCNVFNHSKFIQNLLQRVFIA